MERSWQDPPGSPPGGGLQLAMPPLTPVVKAILFACAGVFLLHFVVSIPAPGLARGITRVLGITPELWLDWFPLAPVWQLLTWGFLHDLGGLTHILFNMLFLYFFGTMLEGILGSRRFLAGYLGALLVSGIVTLFIGVATSPGISTVGASGAGLFVVVAAAMMRPQTRVIFILFPITLKTLALICVGMDVFGTLVSLRDGGTSVAHTAHLAGAAWGWLVVKKGWIWRDPMQALHAGVERHQEERRSSDEERLDELLAKIKNEGIHALNLREKAFLKRMSKRR